MHILKLIRRSILKNKIKKRKKLKRELHNKYGIYFMTSDNCEVLYSINNQFPSEFNYLLTYILSTQNLINGSITIDECYFRKISKNYNILRNLIKEELSKKILHEELVFNISRETTVSNMNNLQNILYSIFKFQNEFNERK